MSHNTREEYDKALADAVEVFEVIPPQTAYDLKEILHALNASEENSDQERIACAGIALTAFLLKKNRDYKSSVFEPPVMAPELSPDAAIRVRVSDKIKRILNLTGREYSAQISESLNDSWLDLAGYALLRTVCPEE